MSGAIDWTKLKEDTRPQRGWWAPGGYINHCRLCGSGFIGDKRAGHCADCAYKEPEKEPEKPSVNPTEAQCVQMFGVVFGNPAQTVDEMRVAFNQQEPSVIEGWKRLAHLVNSVTTAQTLEYIMKDWR